MFGQFSGYRCSLCLGNIAYTHQRTNRKSLEGDSFPARKFPEGNDLNGGITGAQPLRQTDCQRKGVLPSTFCLNALGSIPGNAGEGQASKIENFAIMACQCPRGPGAQSYNKNVLFILHPSTVRLGGRRNRETHVVEPAKGHQPRLVTDCTGRLANARSAKRPETVLLN